MGRIYVASLAAYNAGTLHGVWIEATSDADAMLEGIEAMLASCPEHGEEWAIHDYEDFPNMGEHGAISEIADVADLLERFDRDAVHAALGNFTSIAEAREALDEHYAGEYDGIGAWAVEYLEDSGRLDGLADDIRYHINYEGWAEDASLNGDIWYVEVGRRVHVFWNR